MKIATFRSLRTAEKYADDIAHLSPNVRAAVVIPHGREYAVSVTDATGRVGLASRGFWERKVSFIWKRDAGLCWIAFLPDDIMLSVTPCNTRARGSIVKPARNTKWRAQASKWDETTRTISRYGRDEHSILYDTADEAKRAAEHIYFDAKLRSE